MMDNPQQSSISESKTSISEDPQLSAKSFYGKRNWKEWSLIYLFIAAVVYGAVYFLFLSKQGLNPYSANTQAPKSTPQPTQAVDETTNWKTYRDDKLRYEFKYPPNNIEPSRMQGDTTFVIGYLLKGSKGSKDPDGTYWITLGYISPEALSVRGATYCEGYPKASSRCEFITVGGVNITIDWSIPVEYTKISPEGREEKGTQIAASASISHPNGGIVTFALQPVVPESKETFYQILSTFKFTDQEQTIDTTSWKTYTNTTFKYQIKYPDGYQVMQQTDRQKSQLGVDENTCIASNTEKTCKLIINALTLSQYKLIDNPGGFIFYFDVNKKQWLHDKTNDTSQFVPKRTESSIEAYTYKTGDVKCSQEYTLIPTPAFNNMIEIVNTKCRDDEGNPLPGYDDFSTDQILSTFRFE